MKRRDALKLAGMAAGAAIVGVSPSSEAAGRSAKLKPITGDARPISVKERKARIAKAQKLMNQHGIDAILLEPGSAMLYFSGVS